MLNINTEVIQLNQQHPLICSAGRIRKEKGDCKLFSGLVGNKHVRKLFAIK